MTGQADVYGHLPPPLSILCRSQCGQVSRGMPYLNTNIALLQPLHVDSLIHSPVVSSVDQSSSSSNSIVEFGIQVINASNVSHSRSAITRKTHSLVMTAPFPAARSILQCAFSQPVG